MLQHSRSALARVSQQLSYLEKGDWELWVIVSITGMMVSVGLLILIIPGAFKKDSIDFHVVISRPLGIGLFVLLALLNTASRLTRLDSTSSQTIFPLRTQTSPV